MSTVPLDSVQSQEAFAALTQVRVPRVNLLPPEIVEGRRLRRTKGVLAGSLVAVIAALGGVYALQLQTSHRAQNDLDEAQTRGVHLKAQQQKYADVPATIAAIDAAETARATAMANDVEWYRTMTNFAVTLPSNVWFTTLQLQLNAGTGAAVPQGPGIGQISVTGQALDHPDVATWLDVLGRQPGVSNAYFSSSSKTKVGSKTVVTFTSTATLTDESLSHRYDRKQG
jgi:Tfp pilus assembly protein PilN